MKKALVIDAFCMRQWDNNYVGTRLSSILTPEALEQACNEYYIANGGEVSLKEGYAPFCKHLFVPNAWDKIKTGIMEITKENSCLLRSGYEARTPKELPVLGKYKLVKNKKG